MADILSCFHWELIVMLLLLLSTLLLSKNFRDRYSWYDVCECKTFLICETPASEFQIISEKSWRNVSSVLYVHDDVFEILRFWKHNVIAVAIMHQLTLSIRAAHEIATIKMSTPLYICGTKEIYLQNFSEPFDLCSTNDSLYNVWLSLTMPNKCCQ